MNVHARNERRAARKKQPRTPIEDDRVSRAWERQEGREAAERRRAEEAQAMRKQTPENRIEVRRVEIDNPDWSRARDGQKGFPRIVQAESIKTGSAIESLVRRSNLSLAQTAAAERFQVYWERIGHSGPCAIDWRKEPVDGGGRVPSMPDSVMDAGEHLQQAKEKVGERNFALVSRICGDGCSFKELGADNKRKRDTMSDNLKDSLDDLAELWRLA